MSLEDYQVYLKNYTLYVNYVQMRRSAAAERTPPKEKRQKPQKVTKEVTPDTLEKAAEAKRQRKLAKNRRRRLSRRTRKLAATAKILEGAVKVATLERKLVKVSASAKTATKEKDAPKSYASAAKEPPAPKAKVSEVKKDTTPTKQTKVEAQKLRLGYTTADAEAALRRQKQERRAAQLSSASKGEPVVYEVPSYEHPAEVADALGAVAFSGRQYTPSPVVSKLPSPFATGATTPADVPPATPRFEGFREVLPGPSVPTKQLPRTGGLNVSSNPDDVDPAVRQAWYQKGTGNVIYFKGTTIDQVAPASGNGRSYKGKKYYLSHSYAING